MGKQENKIENYIDAKVESIGGITRKWVSPSHVGVPDRICLLPANSMHRAGLAFFVEAKTLNGSVKSWQKREHTRLREMGFLVFVPFTEKDVDEMIDIVFKIYNEGL